MAQTQYVIEMKCSSYQSTNGLMLIVSYCFKLMVSEFLIP
jgi:hypothetical protein